MVMPGVLKKPEWPSRACDEARSNCSRSLSWSFSAGEERGEANEMEKMRGYGGARQER